MFQIYGCARNHCKSFKNCVRDTLYNYSLKYEKDEKAPFLFRISVPAEDSGVGLKGMSYSIVFLEKILGQILLML